jgi:hypothetical protein
VAQRALRAVGFPDLLIAAVAEREQVTLLHYDSDYDLIAQVTAQPMQWVVPCGKTAARVSRVPAADGWTPDRGDLQFTGRGEYSWNNGMSMPSSNAPLAGMCGRPRPAER